jgi:hypothetical protein
VLEVVIFGEKDFWQLLVSTLVTGAMPEAIAGNYWTFDKPNAFYPAAYNNGGSGTTNNMQVQDRYLLNMAYIRLKNITYWLYSSDKHWLKKHGSAHSEFMLV